MSINVKRTIGVTSRYKLRRVKADGTVVQESGWSGNIITKSGLDFMMYRNVGHTNPAINVAVGSSSVPPSMEDTALGAQIAVTGTRQGNITKTLQTSHSPYWAKARTVFRFEMGQAAGNIQEVGAVASFSSSTLISRALVVDDAGNPTTITVLSDEYLDIEWEFYVSVADSSGVFTMDIDGTPTEFAYSIRPAWMGDNWGPSVGSPGVIKLVPETNSGIDYSYAVTGATGLASPDAERPAGSTVAGRFDSSSYTQPDPENPGVRFTYRMPLNNGNAAGGINGFVLAVAGSWTRIQMLLDKPVMKTADKVFELEIHLSLANAEIPE